MTPTIDVLIVDDHPVVRHGLSALLDNEPRIERVLTAGSVAEAARIAVLERPDLAVVDLALPDGSGLDLISEIRRTLPGCALMVLTMSQDDAAVRACLAAGANAFVRKDAPPQLLVRAILTVADGGVVLGPRVGSEPLVGPDAGDLPAPFDRLGPRDLRIVELITEGRANVAIARTLGVSEKTVRNRLSSIFATIGVADRVQAALLARDKGVCGRR